MARTPADRIETAQAAFEAGFLSMAAKKRAQEEVSRAYQMIRDAAHNASIDFANKNGLEGDARWEHFNAFDLPFDLHQFRPRHEATLARWQGEAAVADVRGMIELRNAIKDAALIPAPVKDADAEKVETIRKSIVEIMEQRKAQYVEALEIGRHFGGLPVTVNAHWVVGHKGAQFLRHFFYLNGKFTALQVIMAAADTLQREKEAAGQ